MLLLFWGPHLENDYDSFSWERVKFLGEFPQTDSRFISGPRNKLHEWVPGSPESGVPGSQPGTGAGRFLVYLQREPGTLRGGPVCTCVHTHPGLASLGAECVLRSKCASFVAQCHFTSDGVQCPRTVDRGWSPDTRPWPGTRFHRNTLMKIILEALTSLKNPFPKMYVHFR